jgi:Xaa-Pro aminopeptidase
VTYSLRQERLASLLTSAGVDALLISDLINVRYLSGFTGSNAALLVFGDGRVPVLATDSRYRTQATRQAPDLEVAIERACGRHLAARAAAEGARRIGFESHVVTVDGFEVLRRAVDGAVDGGGGAAGAEFVRAPGLVEALREVKDDGEVALLRAACEAADAALADLVSGGGLRPGRTEQAVARELEARMFDHGADARAFETIVAAGANSAVPHHRPTDAVLHPGDFVKIDFGALVAGYHSDMTRTFVLGTAADWQREIYDLVYAAQRAGVAALGDRVDLSDIDAAARQVIQAAGHGEHFGHGLGHGVGLRIHEAPGINGAAVGSLRVGSVVTVEPGVYLPGRGGVRIEDTVLVGEASSESLSRFPRELTVLD